jgi:hypothetical protein
VDKPSAEMKSSVPAAINHLPYSAKALNPDYYKVRLREIEVGRRFWESKPSPKESRTFDERVVKPLRRLQSRGVVEKIEETTALVKILLLL